MRRLLLIGCLLSMAMQGFAVPSCSPGPHPCEMGVVTCGDHGTCIFGVGYDYTCECTDGYSGDNCEIAPDIECGIDPNPPGGSCPGVCTGGCPNGNLCIIDCALSNECEAASKICPPDFSCEVACTGEESCINASIVCPNVYSCEVTCANNNACSNAVINCSNDGVCDLNCGSEAGACNNTTLNCGDDSCTAFCFGASSPMVNCGNSCDCSIP